MRFYGKKINKKLLINGSGIFISLTLHNYYSEKIFKPIDRPHFTHFAFTIFVNSIMAMLFSYRNLKRSNFFVKFRRQNLFNNFLISILYFVSLQMSLFSLKFINYPTYILFRAIKIIPIVIVSFIFIEIFQVKGNKKKPRLIPIFFMIIGAISFSLGKIFKKYSANYIILGKNNINNTTNFFDDNVSSIGTFLGILILVLSLVLDGVGNFLKEHQFQLSKIGTNEVVFLSNFFCVIFSIILFIPPFGNQLVNSFVYFYKYPIVIFYLLVQSFAQALGQIFSYNLVKEFGAINLVTINMIRKMSAIIISLIIFHGGITISEGIGIFLVLFSIIVENFTKI